MNNNSVLFKFKSTLDYYTLDGVEFVMTAGFVMTQRFQTEYVYPIAVAKHTRRYSSTPIRDLF